MYTVYADDLLIYDPIAGKDRQLVNPKLKIGDNSAGSLEFTIPPTNIGYDSITRLSTTIRVFKDGEWYWEGRILSEELDFWKSKKIVCEGSLAYLNDTIQPLMNYVEDINVFLGMILDIHNSKVADNRKIYLGHVDVTTEDGNPGYFVTDYEDTMTIIRDQLIGDYGGHMRIRKDGFKLYLDYLAEYFDVPEDEEQTIEFGKNLLDFTQNFDSGDFATAVVPLGKIIPHEDEEGNQYEQDRKYVDEHLTIASVNDGKIYIQNDTSVEAYGYIEKVINFDDVEKPEELKDLGELYLSLYQFNTVQIELSAVDLYYYLGDKYRSIELLEKVHVISDPHGLNAYFPLTKLEIPLDKPESTTFTLGGVMSSGLSDHISTQNFDIYKSFKTATEENWSRIKKTETEIYAEVGKTYATQDEAHTLKTSIDVLAGELELKVSDEDLTGQLIASRINLSPNTIKIEAKNISLNGYVGINNGFSVNEQGYMTANAAYIQGTLISSAIQSSTISASQIAAGSYLLCRHHDSPTLYRDAWMKDGQVSAELHNTGANVHKMTKIGYQLLYPSGGTASYHNGIYMGDVDAAGNPIGGSGIHSDTTTLVIEGQSVLTTEGVIIISDNRLKRDITSIAEDERWMNFFDMLRPVTFKYVYGTSGRTHIGYIAQEVIAAAENCNITINELAPICRIEGYIEDMEIWTIRYEEFVALNTCVIQKLKVTVENQNERIERLEALVSSLIN